MNLDRVRKKTALKALAFFKEQGEMYRPLYDNEVTEDYLLRQIDKPRTFDKRYETDDHLISISGLYGHELSDLITRNNWGGLESQVIKDECKRKWREATNLIPLNYLNKLSFSENVEQVLIFEYQSAFYNEVIISCFLDKEASGDARATTIVIADNIVSDLSNGLKDHFENNRHLDLTNALKGNVIAMPLHFKLNQNQLAELFKRIKYNGHITGTNKELIKWLSETFTSTRGGSVDNLNISTITQTINRFETMGTPSKYNRLLLNLFPFKIPSQLKDERF